MQKVQGFSVYLLPPYMHNFPHMSNPYNSRTFVKPDETYIDTALLSKVQNLHQGSLLMLNILQVYTINYKLTLAIGNCHRHLPSTSIRIKSYAVAADDFSTHPERSSECRAEIGHSVLCGRGETGRTSIQIVRYFQELIL